MPCHPRGSLIEAAVCTLIKEIVSSYEARRRARRNAAACAPCPPQRAEETAR